MIDAWDVYWVMQLDEVLDVTGALAVFGTLFGGMAYIGHRIVSAFAESDGDDELQAFAKASAMAKPILLVGLASIAANAFLPTSKTAAAMIVLPALTSDQVVEPLTAEARELYGLAKQALSRVAEPEPEPEAAQK